MIYNIIRFDTFNCFFFIDSRKSNKQSSNKLQLYLFFQYTYIQVL
jgi:hypothetical protein